MHLRTILVVVGLAVGVATGYESAVASELAMFSLVLACVQGGIYMISRKRDAKGVVLSLYTLLFAISFLAGVIRVQLVTESVPFVCESSCTFDARIVRSPEQRDTYQIAIAKVIDDHKDTLLVLVRTPLYPALSIGDTVRITGRVSIPTPTFPHGGDEGFDYASYLRTKRVGSEALFPKIEVVDHEVHTVHDMLGRVREALEEKVNHFVSSPASSLANGMLFGSSSMSKELTTTFRVSGLSHVVVLSGFNIAIVITFVFFLLTFFPLFVRVALAFVCVILFVVMVGGEVSVIRAMLMAFVSLLATLLGREYVARQALLLSFLAIILYEPYALMNDVSLHLSFLATAGIIYMSEPLTLFVGRYVNAPTLRTLVVTTLAAYVVTAPYVAHVFATVSTYALLANALVLPLVPFVMFLSFMTVIGSYVSDALGLLLGYTTSVVGNVVIWVAKVVSDIPFARIDVSLSFFTTGFIYVLISFLTFYFYMRAKNETFQTSESDAREGVFNY